MTDTATEYLSRSVDAWLRDRGYRPVWWRTPRQWAEAGRTTGRGALLHAETDASELRVILDSPATAEHEQFAAMLDALGYWCLPSDDGAHFFADDQAGPIFYFPAPAHAVPLAESA